MKRKYPLKIENWGKETYILASRGHHAFDEFMVEVLEKFPDWPMGNPKHMWAINSFGRFYISENKVKRYFPITITREA